MLNIVNIYIFRIKKVYLAIDFCKKQTKLGGLVVYN